MRGNRLGDSFCMSMLADMILEGRTPEEYSYEDACFFQLKALRYGDDDQLASVLHAYFEGDLKEYAIILVNDDVDFYPGILEKVLACPQDRLYIGATVDDQGNFSYGGIRYHRNLLGQKDIHYDMVPPEAEDRICDTCNANFLWIPGDIFMALPNIDPAYKHSLGDFDYGLTAGRAGYKLEVLDKYVGICPDNPLQISWRNPELSRLERIQKKESIKGAPAGPWFHFLKKNFGIGKALVYSATPYVRIMLGK
jgi:GT2 family glycosyltransferase